MLELLQVNMVISAFKDTDPELAEQALATLRDMHQRTAGPQGNAWPQD